MYERHKTYKCKSCDFVSSRRNKLNEHEENSHRISFSCRMCPFKAKYRDTLRDHIDESHIKITEFKCQKFRFLTTNAKELRDHMENKHSNSVQPCIFWNRGYCKYGQSCTYAHVKIPECQHQDRCRKHRCPLYHHKESLNTFLGRKPMMKVSPQN